jgi:transposase
VPELTSGDTAIIDNLSSHKVQGIGEILKASGITLKFLPPYSPELSPMEKAISKIKGKLRKMAARSYEALVDAMKESLDDVSSNHARGWFKGCGYCIEAG